MKEIKGRDLILPLPRPEYVPMPEGFLSSLAWKAYSVKKVPVAPEGQKLGLRYKFVGGPSAAKSVHFEETFPRGEVLAELGKSLEEHGLEETGNKSLLSEAVVNSVVGSSSPKSKSIPSSPLTPALALMQNPVGLTGKRNPPDLGNIIEVMYSLGKKGNPPQSAANLYSMANSTRLTSDPILAAINSAFIDAVWGGEVAEVSVEATVIDSPITAELVDSPFSWFAETWDKVTSDQWVLALPAKVWVDWSTCILRTGFAMAYLWEASWYESLAREILSKNSVDVGFISRVMESLDPAIVWRGSESTAEIRDLASKLKWRCYRSVSVRNVLEGVLGKHPSKELSISDFVALIRSDSELTKQLQSALNPNKQVTLDPADKLWEAIRYSLKTRDKGDHYGFLESSGRYLFANPGTEWGALMASMAARGPGETTNLGEVAVFLNQSGTTTQPQELLALLERTGLSRGSADADLALEVETAYRRGAAIEPVI